MANANPSFGYTVLAQIIATTKHNVVITTNFDNLVQEALNLIGKPRSFIAHSPAEARFIGQNAGRPRILKIHGDIDRETYNRDNLIENLDAAWHDALRHILDIYTPIFIGYGGCDPGFMHFLNDLYQLTPNRRRPLWTYRVAAGELKQPLPLSSPPPGYPCTGFVCSFMEKHQAFWVPTPGFDELMLLLSPALAEKYDAASVRATAEQTSQALGEKPHRCLPHRPQSRRHALVPAVGQTHQGRRKTPPRRGQALDLARVAGVCPRRRIL